MAQKIVNYGIGEVADCDDEDSSTPDASNSYNETGYLLYLGRIDGKKRIDRLLEAYAQMRDVRPRLVIAGEGDLEYKEQLRGQAQALGLSESISWLGHVAGAPKQTLIKRASVLCLLSDQENFGVVVAEALRLGTPVVVSENVALSGAVKRYGAGVVVDGADSSSAARAIETAIGDGHGEFSTNARTLYSDELTAAAAARSLLDVLTELQPSP